MRIGISAGGQEDVFRMSMLVVGEEFCVAAGVRVLYGLLTSCFGMWIQIWAVDLCSSWYFFLSKIQPL